MHKGSCCSYSCFICVGCKGVCIFFFLSKSQSKLKSLSKVVSSPVHCSGTDAGPRALFIQFLSSYVFAFFLSPGNRTLFAVLTTWIKLLFYRREKKLLVNLLLFVASSSLYFQRNLYSEAERIVQLWKQQLAHNKG